MAFRDLIDKTVWFLNDRKTAYQLMFAQPAGKAVLSDLIKFSKIVEGPMGRTDAETYRLIGRQDVIRRIQEHMNFSTEQLFALYNSLPVPNKEESFDG